ncbi:OPT family oligopeptide transporter [candidate division KSB1 bacterium]
MTGEMQKLREADERWVRDVYKGDKMPELTFRVVVTGVLLAMVMISSNIYMGMKTGWTEGGSIISAILAFALLKTFRGGLSPLENNIAQTMGSAGGSLGNMVNVIPALILLGYPLTGLQIFIWVFCVSFLGIFFAVPLRRQIVVIEKLRFPTGTACAETIQAMHARGSEAMKKAKMLGITGGFSALFTWFREGVPRFIPSQTALPGAIGGFSMSQLTLGLSWSPMMFGAGFLIGPRVGVSLFIGSVATWAGFAPWLVNGGIIEEMTYRNITHWTMWVGTALMVAAALTSTALKGKVVVRAFRSMRQASYSGASNLEFPFRLWWAGLAAASVLVIVLMYVYFGVAPWLGLLAIILSFLLAMVSVRATGETDINPVGAMGHITQIVFGVLSPGNIPTNMLTAGVTSAGASEAADMMQDLKAGYLLGATPRKQVYAQFIGVLAGAAVAAPIFIVVSRAYGIGTESMPAPAAVVWEGLARLLAQGLSALPQYTLTAVIISALIGVGLAVVDLTEYKRYTPSAIGLGVAMIVPGYYCISMFLGSMALLILRQTKPKWTETFYASIASGGIAGEGIMGVLVAALIVFGVISH